MALINIQNLNKSYGKTKILEDLTFTLDTPEIIALVAPNGSGKTTLMDILCHLEDYQSGELELLGKSIDDPTLFEEVSYMQNVNVLFDDLTADEHLDFVAKIHHKSKSDIENIKERVGITHYGKKKVSQYSLGMKQHLLFAVSILSEPKLLFLDEPMNGLDPTSVVTFRHLLLDLKAQGTTIIFSSHYLSEVQNLTDQIVFLFDKKLLSVAEIKRRATYTLYLESASEGNELIKKAGFQVETSIIDTHKLIIATDAETIERITEMLTQQQITIFGCEEQLQSLEDVYFELYRGQVHDEA